MKMRTLGDQQVSAIGLGAMPMSTKGDVPESQAERTVHAALDAGVTLIDTADAYSPDEHTVGHNERLIAAALRSYGGDTSRVLVATKGGHTRVADGGWDVDSSPAYLKRACEASLQALGVEAIGLYQHHRPDPKVPYADAIGAIKQLRDEGKVRLVGISNANIEQIREAMEILGPGGLASVQNQFSPDFRSSLDELELCAQEGVAFLPWSPLGGGGSAGAVGQRHAAFAEVATERGVSPQQVALAWMLAKSPVVIPIPGASRPESMQNSAQAIDLELSADELERLDKA